MSKNRTLEMWKHPKMSLPTAPLLPCLIQRLVWTKWRESREDTAIWQCHPRPQSVPPWVWDRAVSGS